MTCLYDVFGGFNVYRNIMIFLRKSENLKFLNSDLNSKFRLVHFLDF